MAVSVFTSRNTRTIEIPHDPGQTATIRQLAPRHLERATKEAQRQSLADFRAMGGAAVLAELQEIAARASTTTGETVRDPLAGVDRVTLITAGVTAWSYDAPIDAETVADLDERTQRWLAEQVLRFSRPELFEAPDAQEAAAKNG